MLPPLCIIKTTRASKLLINASCQIVALPGLRTHRTMMPRDGLAGKGLKAS